MPTKLLLAWELPLVPTTPGFEALGVLGCDSFLNIRVVKLVGFVGCVGFVCHLNFSSVEIVVVDCPFICFLCIGNVLSNLRSMDAVIVNVNVDVKCDVNFPPLPCFNLCQCTPTE